MKTATNASVADKPVKQWLVDIRNWLDERGKPAWIATMVLGFIIFWPLGLAVLFYMIYRKKRVQFGHHRSNSSRNKRCGRSAFRSSGNQAFDNYKAQTLERLIDEQEAFENFLERLRAAKDKSEFDRFMDEREASRDAANLEAPEDSGELQPRDLEENSPKS